MHSWPTTLIFGAAYTLWMIKRVVFGDIANPQVAALKDANGREIFFLSVLALLVLLLGLKPAPLVNVTQTSITGLLTHITQTKY